MKLTKLQELRSIETLPSINKVMRTNMRVLVSDLDILVYSVNLCFYASQILNNKINVKNRDEILRLTTDEAMKMYNLIKKKDFLLYADITQMDMNKFYKKIKFKVNKTR